MDFLQYTLIAELRAKSKRASKTYRYRRCRLKFSDYSWWWYWCERRGASDSWCRHATNSRQQQQQQQHITAQRGPAQRRYLSTETARHAHRQPRLHLQDKRTTKPKWTILLRDHRRVSACWAGRRNVVRTSSLSQLHVSDQSIYWMHHQHQMQWSLEHHERYLPKIASRLHVLLQ